MEFAVMVRLGRLLTSSSISLQTKYRLYKSLVAFILLYGCKTWIPPPPTAKAVKGLRRRRILYLTSVNFMRK
ncbi:hypothetical protein DPMN_109644 [Dreissena polymorpha]|uniref:Uncharacterized protein n=1 Tax=Dreissena polymorpha TaxID=45954 RepID=A0A9D4KB58_DREPO|nr:hypothetical protein DPMN_109644 [Dreissena polymorpha]